MRRLFMAICAAGVLAGCGGDDTETVTVTTPATTGQTATATTPATTSTAATTTEPATPALNLDQFQTPSRNIGCVLSEDSARCDIKDKTWSPPPKPADCDVDFGQGLRVTAAGAGDVVCAGDTAQIPGAPVLEYGQRTANTGFECSSTEDGVTCKNRVTGHGFLINRDRYRLF